MPTHTPEDNQDSNPHKTPSRTQRDTIHGSSQNRSDEHTGSGEPTDQKKRRYKPQVVNIGSIPKIDVIEGVEANAIAERANTIARSANSISRLGMAINALIFGVTACLALLATCQYHSTIVAQRHSDTTDSINQIRAENTFNADTLYNYKTLRSQKIASRKADSLDSIKTKQAADLFTLQQKTYVSNDSDMKQRFKRDTEALNLQIKSLKQSQDQFTKEHEPYLKISIDSIGLNYKKPIVAYTIINLSNTPIKITHQKSSIQCLEFKPIVFGGLTDDGDVGMYITKEAPQAKYITLNDVTTNELKWIMTGYYSIYWYASFEYVNLISSEKRVYNITVKITKLRNGATYSEFLNNENKSE